MNYKNQKIKLDKIIEKALSTLDQSKDEINEISAFAKSEFMIIEEEFIKIQIETANIIENIEKLENDLKMSKVRLSYVNKNYEQFTEQQMKEIYEETDNIRVQLVIENEKSVFIIKQRNELELRLKSAKKIYEKADKLSNEFTVAYGFLSGDLNQITKEIDNIQDKEIWGIKVLEAQERERKRIARDMHDGPTQNLSNLILKTELCIKLIDKDVDLAKLELHSLKKFIRTTIDETRRLIHNLRPMSLDDLGIIPSLERLVDEVRAEGILKLEFTHEKKFEDNLDPILTTTIYRICQEAFNNIKKHSFATKVIIDININEDTVKLIIKDNGVGFDINNVKLNYEDNRGFGISIMRERTNLLLGEFEIKSIISMGTTITVNIPTMLRREGIANEEN